MPNSIFKLGRSGTPEEPVVVESRSATVTALPGASGAVAPGAEALVGLTMRETTGVALAVVRLRDGVVGGTILATISLTAEESVREPLNVEVTNPAGVYVELVSGTVEGSVFTL